MLAWRRLIGEFSSLEALDVQTKQGFDIRFNHRGSSDSSVRTRHGALGAPPCRTMQFVSGAEGHEEMRTYIRSLKGQR